MFNNIYNKIIKEEFNNKFVNQTIGIYAGSFRLPYKEDIYIINELLQFCNKVIIQISNISEQNIINRKLSKTNLQDLSKFIISNNLKGKNIDQIINNIQDYSFQQICQLLRKTNNNKIEQYIQKTQKKLFSDIDYFKEKQLTAEIIVNIFKILLTDPRVQFVISTKPSPIIDTIDYVQENCINCNIKLVSISDINSDMTTWQSLLNYFSNTNNIQEYFPKYKKILNRQNIISDLAKNDAIKYYANIQQYNKIKEILNG